MQQEAGLARGHWGATVGTAIALQWGVILVLAGAAWIWGGTAARSLLLGGAAVALPNTALALWLTLRVRASTLSVVAVMAGELLKLGFTIALLALVVARLKPDLSLLALIVGVIGALKAQWLALWFTRNL
jgi:F0F1-type ATP synthase assembly protein I